MANPKRIHRIKVTLHPFLSALCGEILQREGFWLAAGNNKESIWLKNNPAGDCKFTEAEADALYGAMGECLTDEIEIELLTDTD